MVSNNHHFRVAPFEKRIPWAVSLGACPESYASEENLLPGAAHAELSHHLAHAWSAAALAPFDSGLIVVMVRAFVRSFRRERVTVQRFRKKEKLLLLLLLLVLPRWCRLCCTEWSIAAPRRS